MQNTSSPKEIIEAKYAVGKDTRDMLLAILRQKADVPPKFSYSRMKTIYFDDVEENSYFDSRDGNLYRKKYRLREYIEPEEGGAFYSLEIKTRDDAKTSKIKELIYKKLPLDYKVYTFRDLIQTIESMLGFSLSLVSMELPENDLFPSATVYYERYRFDDYYEDKRYNLDTNIMICPHEKLDISQAGIYLDHDIFEIKGYGLDTLPIFLKPIRLEPLSLSKFIWGQEIFE